MAKIKFIEFNGNVHEIESESGKSVMKAAVEKGVPGIDADCGGECACATCHIHVDPAWIGKTGVRSDSEESLLAFVDGADSYSRLSCQIQVADELDGLVVRLPEFQH